MVARDAKIWAPASEGAASASVRALEARVVARAYERRVIAPEHVVIVVQRNVPISRWEGRRRLPTRADAARDVLWFERGVRLAIRIASRAPERTYVSIDEGLHISWHSGGRGEYRARSRCARSQPPRRTRRGVRRKLGRCPEGVPRRGTSPAAGDCHATFERRAARPRPSQICASSSSPFPDPLGLNDQSRRASPFGQAESEHPPDLAPSCRGQDVVFAGLPRSVDRPGGVRRRGGSRRSRPRRGRRQAFAYVFLTNAIVLVPMVASAQIGTKYGAPFPVAAPRSAREARASYSSSFVGSAVRDPDARGRRREGARHGGCRLWRVRGWVPRHVGDVRRDVAVDAASRVVRPRRDPPGLGVLFLLPLRSARDRAEGRREHQDRGADRRAVPVRPDARDVRLGVADGRGHVRGDVPSERRGRRRRGGGGGGERGVRVAYFFRRCPLLSVLGSHGAQHLRLFQAAKTRDQAVGQALGLTGS